MGHLSPSSKRLGQDFLHPPPSDYAFAFSHALISVQVQPPQPVETGEAAPIAPASPPPMPPPVPEVPLQVRKNASIGSILELRMLGARFV